MGIAEKKTACDFITELDLLEGTNSWSDSTDEIAKLMRNMLKSKWKKISLKIILKGQNHEKYKSSYFNYISIS